MGNPARHHTALLNYSMFLFPGRRTYLATLFGERDPSSLGHQGAGKMLSDMWVFDIEGKTWEKVDAKDGVPDARGWFDADVLGKDAIAVHGRSREDNERLRDVWSLNISSREVIESRRRYQESQK